MTTPDPVSALMALADDRQSLARRITSPLELKSLSREELGLLNAEHDNEILSLSGRIDAAQGDRPWVGPARRALRVLNAHREWIRRELAERKRQAREEAQVAQAQVLQLRKVQTQALINARESAARADKAARIAASNDEAARHVAVFKEVAREVLGAEMYDHLWQLTQARIAGL